MIRLPKVLELQSVTRQSHVVQYVLIQSMSDIHMYANRGAEVLRAAHLAEYKDSHANNNPSTTTNTVDTNYTPQMTVEVQIPSKASVIIESGLWKDDNIYMAYTRPVMTPQEAEHVVYKDIRVHIIYLYSAPCNTHRVTPEMAMSLVDPKKRIGIFPIHKMDDRAGAWYVALDHYSQA